MKFLSAAFRIALLVALPTGLMIAGVLLNMDDADHRAAAGGTKPDVVTTGSITR
jgi:hypothetical protein